VYLEVFEGLEQHGLLANFRVLNEQLLVALDGTQYHSSSAIHGRNCLRRHTSNGRTLHYHSAITPVIVCPGRSEVLALPPEFIRHQDGHEKQDCERVAGKRWIDQHAKQVAPHGITLLGDDLYSNQPLCQLARQNGFNFIFVCKPDSHTTLYERLALWHETGALQEVESRRRRGRVTEVLLYRYSNKVYLRRGKGALSVNGLEITSVDAKTGEQLYHNSFITNHQVTDDNVADIAQAGRGHWKIENENNNVLKTKGYHVEPNFGHGKKYLSAFMLSLNLLAFLFHTVLEWCEDKYALIRQVLARRQTFFDDIRALTRYIAFESWHHLMDFMIRGLNSKPGSKPGSKPSSKPCSIRVDPQIYNCWRSGALCSPHARFLDSSDPSSAGDWAEQDGDDDDAELDALRSGLTQSPSRACRCSRGDGLYHRDVHRYAPC
jgi:hypothetical protein